MKIVSADFIKGATRADQYPKTGKTEFAFFGRSNTGKSSLINMLVNRKSLVKTGSRPGMTREINFFAINDSFTLVDLPGYGYAQRSASEQTAFDRMLDEYCRVRKELRAIFFLVDLRRESGEVEKASVEYFEKLGLEVIIVGTKADKLGKNEVLQVARRLAAFFGRPVESILVTSALKKTGRDLVLSRISAALRPVASAKAGSVPASAPMAAESAATASTGSAESSVVSAPPAAVQS